MAAKVGLVVLGLITVISLLYAVSYINDKNSSRISIDTFVNNSKSEYRTEVPITPGPASTEQPTVVPTSAAVTVTPSEMPYEQKPIDDVDDYEYNLVYQNESVAPLSKELRNKLM